MSVCLSVCLSVCHTSGSFTERLNIGSRRRRGTPDGQETRFLTPPTAAASAAGANADILFLFHEIEIDAVNIRPLVGDKLTGSGLHSTKIGAFQKAYQQ